MRALRELPVFLILLLVVSNLITIENAFGIVELKQGRYIGSISLDSTKDKIAVVSDFYIESPEDLKIFPSLHAAVKMTLGGFNTHEYVTEIFENVRYDFDNGVLTLDDPKNDLVITSELKEQRGEVHIIGDVFIRSAAIFGKIDLLYESDEPGEGRTPTSREENNFIPSLDGQYEGLCGGERSVLQLQTVRGLKTVWQGEGEASSLSRYYGISARVGVQSSTMCGNLPVGLWCSLFNYGGGSYNAYQGKLLLKGPSATDECSVRRDTIKCEIRRTGWNKTCEFKKVKSKIKEVKFFSRGFNTDPTTEQSKELPPANPPKNIELSNAVRGTFSGYLHNETNNTYQFLRLNVMPFNFSDNPHNPNQMMITSSLSLHLGKDASGPYITQRFEPRSFYIRPGFTLNGPNTDSFINVSEWKNGFIRGTLYSHAFGKVGTVQLIKGVPSAPPAGVEMLRNFVGDYEGPIGSDGVSANMRWFRFLFPAQPNDLTDNLIRFSGSYSPLVDVMAVRNIDRGTFDPYTGIFGWIIEKEGSATFSNGQIDKANNVAMYWPPAPDIFGAFMTDYVPETFKRK